MKRLIFLLSLVLLAPPPALAQQIAGQKPVMMIGDTFQFIPGSWATYALHDKKEDTYYTMTMSILDSVRKNGKDCAWMEIEIETDKELVVTRMLTEKTKNGPGEVLAVIVYIQGFTPFTIPQKWIKGDEQQVAEFKVGHVQQHVNQRTITFGGRQLDVTEVDAIDDSGTKIAATASVGITPIGVLYADTPDVGMYLEDWGMGARTKIVGQPESFYLWMIGQVGGALSDAKVKTQSRPQRQLDVAGMWEEMDGPCAGSRWVFAGAFPTAARVDADSRCGGQASPAARAANARWAMDKIVTLSLPGRGPDNSRVSVIFRSPTRAVVAFTDRNGRAALATLRKSGA